MYGGMARLRVRTKAVKRLQRQRLRRQLGAGDPALSLEAVTLPAAMLDKGRLALFGGGGPCDPCPAAAEDEAGGERRQPTYTNKTHQLFSP